MLAWLKKNREWVFSGVGVATCAALISLFVNNQQQAAQKLNQSGSNNIQAGGNVTVSQNPSLSQQEISGNFPLYEYPVIDLERPIEEQVQLFATDEITIYGADNVLEEVWFGLNWEDYISGRTYIVTGIPSVPVIPKFRGTGESFKVEISYTSNRDQPRDLR